MPTADTNLSVPDLVVQSAYIHTVELPLPNHQVKRTRKLEVSVKNAGTKDAPSSKTAAILIKASDAEGESLVSQLILMDTDPIKIGEEVTAEATAALLDEKGMLVLVPDVPVQGHPYGQVGEFRHNAFVTFYWPDKTLTLHNPAA